jgi:hypothetical protein
MQSSHLVRSNNNLLNIDIAKSQLEEKGVSDLAKVPQTTKQLVVAGGNIDFNEITDTPCPAPSII